MPSEWEINEARRLNSSGQLSDNSTIRGLQERGLDHVVSDEQMTKWLNPTQDPTPPQTFPTYSGTYHSSPPWYWFLSCIPLLTFGLSALGGTPILEALGLTLLAACAVLMCILAYYLPTALTHGATALGAMILLSKFFGVTFELLVLLFGGLGGVLLGVAGKFWIYNDELGDSLERIWSVLAVAAIGVLFFLHFNRVTGSADLNMPVLTGVILIAGGAFFKLRHIRGWQSSPISYFRAAMIVGGTASIVTALSALA